jgi:RHS repeat-associated protein
MTGRTIGGRGRGRAGGLRVALRLMSVLGVGLAVGPSAWAQTTETVTYYHTDAVGSVRMTTGASGQVLARYDYWPFGVPVQLPAQPDVRQFAGKERDPESGLNYFGARYYASQSGRFTTVDPVLDMRGALVDSQQWNRYAYVRNNPFRYVDPDGRCSKPVDQKEGETGICVEAFIADNWFRGIARGDNRGFSGTDPTLTARSRVKVTVGSDGKVTSEVVESERSGLLCKGCGFKGDTVATTASRQNADGSTSVHVSLWGRNGEAFAAPVAPSGVLQGHVNINISAAGEVSLVLDGSSLTTYPSWGVYGYPSAGGVTTLRQENQQTIDGLRRPPVPLR